MIPVPGNTRVWLAPGVTDKAHAEAPIKVLDATPDADGDWIASSGTHVWGCFNNGGATTTVEAALGMEE